MRIFFRTSRWSALPFVLSLLSGCLSARETRIGPAAAASVDACATHLYHCSEVDAGPPGDTISLPDAVVHAWPDCGPTFAADGSLSSANLQSSEIVVQDLTTSAEHAYILYKDVDGKYKVTRMDLATGTPSGAAWTHEVLVEAAEDVALTLSFNSVHDVYYVGLDRSAKNGSVDVYGLDGAIIQYLEIPAGLGEKEVKPISSACFGSNCFVLGSKWMAYQIGAINSTTFYMTPTKGWAVEGAGTTDLETGEASIATANERVYYGRKGSDKIHVYDPEAQVLLGSYSLNLVAGSSSGSVCGLHADACLLWVDDCSMAHALHFEMNFPGALRHSFDPSTPAWANQRFGPRGIDRGVVFLHQGAAQVPALSFHRF